MERWIEDAKKFLTGVIPQVVVSDQVTDFMAFDLKFVPQERDKMTILKQAAMYANQIGNSPEQERVLTQIGRQQEVKSGLYLMLLQKREKTPFR